MYPVGCRDELTLTEFRLIGEPVATVDVDNFDFDKDVSGDFRTCHKNFISLLVLSVLSTSILDHLPLIFVYLFADVNGVLNSGSLELTQGPPSLKLKNHPRITPIYYFQYPKVSQAIISIWQ